MKNTFSKFVLLMVLGMMGGINTVAQYNQQTLDKYLTSGQSDEVSNSLLMIKSELTNFYPSEITALVKNSYPQLPEDKTIRVLPYVREHMISEGKSYDRVKRVAGNLLKFMSLQERVRVIYFDSEIPVTAFTYPFALVVSSAAEQVLSDDELEALCAHEIMHLVAYQNFKLAVEKKDYKQMRMIELFCDAGAISILDAKGKDPSTLNSGLEKMQSLLARVDNAGDTGLEHPTMKQRRRFYKELIGKIYLATNRADQLSILKK